MIDARTHWENVYRTKRFDQVSWYRPHLELSLDLIVRTVPELDAHIIDVGAGESTLVDDLLKHGYYNVYAEDISAAALDVARKRLGGRADQVHWLIGDVGAIELERHRFDLWHDRAVFHFLTRAEDRAAYVRQVAHSVKPRGHVIVATFGPEGPTKCSGLDVVRYDTDTLHDEFGAAFQLIDHRMELHQTPMGTTQQFTYCLCRID